MKLADTAQVAVGGIRDAAYRSCLEFKCFRAAYPPTHICRDGCGNTPIGGPVIEAARQSFTP